MKSKQPDIPAMVRGLKERIKAWEKAADGDSNDAEHERAYELVQDLRALIHALGK